MAFSASLIVVLVRCTLPLYVLFVCVVCVVWCI